MVESMKRSNPNLIVNSTDDELRLIVCEHLDKIPATSKTLQWRLGARTLEDRQRLNQALAVMVKDKELGHFRAGNQTFFASNVWFIKQSGLSKELIDPRQKVLCG